MNKKRLMKTVKFLEKLPEDKFDFSSVVSQDEKKEGLTCGSVCCVIGWTPAIFPDLISWTQTGHVTSVTGLHMKADDNGSEINLRDYEDIGAELFDITMGESENLFNPDSQEYLGMDIDDLGDEATAKQVAKAIRQFIAFKEKEAKSEN